jgi:hypothetical protein
MSGEPDLIAGIYSYCDRWCERCAFTSRCLQFRIETGEKESGGALQEFDALNARFWQEMGEALVQAMRFIRDIAAKEGLGADELQKETVFSELPASSYRNAREHPCSNAALVYAGMVNEWFASADDISDADASLLSNVPASLEEPVQIIRHYQYFIYPKIVRAIEGRMSDTSAGVNELENDANGTAKIALITIDRSLAAWSLFYGEYPAKEDGTLSILVHLDRLRRSVEVVFPAARSFKRPGLDV